ncbi:MAG TPA: hypothetical protein DCP92_00340 [Nitrospiraceae bacterium]|nr:hypothetical protein [Nitrospiraceae bacterium]
MKSDREFLRHIIDEIQFVMRETRGLTFDAFMKDEKLKRACTRSLEIIGEASKNLSAGLKKRHKDVQWKKLAGMRDKIIHFYFGVNWDIVWDVIEKRLPDLKDKVEKILQEEDGLKQGIARP